MLRNTFHTGIACTLLTLSLGFVVAQSREQPKTKQDSTMALRAKSILGAKVELKGNAHVGTIEDIVFDDEGVIDYFIVSDGKQMITVPWEAAKFNFEKRMATINITQEQYKEIPTYTTERYPEYYAPTYRTEVYRFYGLMPGQERRFERRSNRK